VFPIFNPEAEVDVISGSRGDLLCRPGYHGTVTDDLNRGAIVSLRARLEPWIARVATATAISAAFASATAHSSTAATATAASRAVPVIVVTAGKPTEHAFKLSAKSVKHGTVIFKLVNAGKVGHGFQIAGYSTKLVRPHRSTALTVTFKAPGKYVYQCVVTYGSSDDVSDAGPASVANPDECGSGVLKVT
jgi:plastocyanin